MNFPQTPLVFDRSGKAVTDSLTVARAFGKRHSNVLRDIDDIITQVLDLGVSLNFEQSRRCRTPDTCLVNHEISRYQHD